MTCLISLTVFGFVSLSFHSLSATILDTDSATDTLILISVTDLTGFRAQSSLTDFDFRSNCNAVFDKNTTE